MFLKHFDSFFKITVCNCVILVRVVVLLVVSVGKQSHPLDFWSRMGFDIKKLAG